jgi:hypothetical protein
MNFLGTEPYAVMREDGFELLKTVQSVILLIPEWKDCIDA